ncbi:MAG: preprotein translocase subunit YajC [Halanaerobiaceae bacterium]
MQGTLGFIAPLVIIFGIFWFLIIRPQRKQQQDHEEMLDNLKPGDRIITIGGIKGKVIKIMDDNVRLRIAADTDIEVVNRSISRIDESGDTAAEGEEEN